MARKTIKQPKVIGCVLGSVARESFTEDTCTEPTRSKGSSRADVWGGAVRAEEVVNTKTLRWNHVWAVQKFRKASVVEEA